MAAVSEDISDRDLRQKLKEHGISTGPITPTTKSLYIRKLNKKLLGAESGLSSTVKKPAKKSLSPRRSPGRSPARDSRRSFEPTSSPRRKLVGFSSDEEEVVKESPVPRSRRLSGRLEPGSSSATRGTRSEEEQPLRFRHRPVDSSSYKVIEDEEKTDIDGRVNVPTNHHEFRSKTAKPSPYLGLQKLFLLRSKEDSQKSSARNPPRNMSHDVEVKNESQRNVYNRYIWVILLLSAVVVFLLYNWHFLKSEDSNSLQICGSRASSSETEACLKEEDFVQILLDKLQYELAEKSGLVKCGYSNEGGGEIKKDELVKWIARWPRSTKFQCGTLLKSMFSQVQKTSGYDLSFLDENGTAVSDVSNVVIVKTTLVLKPLLCRIREAFSKVILQLVFLSAVIILGLCVYFYVKYRWRLQERKTRQVFELIDQILDVLKNHHNECQRNKDLSPYLAIPHVRDMLIKPSERELMKKVWDQAVKFLSANDSRVRVESQRIAGEDFEVWRLLHHGSPTSPGSPSGSDAKDGKVWQGPAFIDFKKSVNPPPTSPTPCLKIRNMFEPVMEIRDHWHISIQDAILEKCNEKGAAIVHIAVDQSSSEGCVYVKCANHHSSGIAYRAIHGCWFDGRLVTVKFLKLKRYHQRFPESISAKEPIQLSGMSNSTIPKLNDPINDTDSDSETEEPVVVT